MNFWVVLMLIFAAYLGFAYYFWQREQCSEWAYDERQEQARGVAYKYGFFALLISIWLFSQFAEVFPWIGVEAGGFLCVDLGVTVFAVTAVWKDAYLRLYERPGRTVAGLALVGAWCLCLGAFKVWKEGALAGGTLNLWVVIVVASIQILLVLLLFLYKQFRARREEDEA